jgi:hypothetical protein
MRMDEHTHGTVRFWRESTPTHEIKFAAGKLQTPGTVDRQRDVVAQRAVSKGRGDDAGHLIAHQFGGPEAPYMLLFKLFGTLLYSLFGAPIGDQG